MDKRNPLYDKNYPNWKKNLWGCLRAFVGGFLSSLSVFLLTVDEESVVSSEWWLRIVLTGSLVGGFVALGKFLRDLYPESPIIARIPI